MIFPLAVRINIPIKYNFMQKKYFQYRPFKRKKASEIDQLHKININIVRRMR